jgi:DNA-binding CsgD family transcriptional regulator
MVHGARDAECDWMELAAELLAAPLTELPVERVALQLTRTFTAVGCSFSSQSDRELRRATLYPLNESFAGHRGEIEEWGARYAMRRHPILQYYRATGNRTQIQVADVPECCVEPGALAHWYARSRPWGAGDQLAFPVRLRPHRFCAFVIGRDAPFTPVELELGRRIWRLLIGLDRQVQALDALRPVADVAAGLQLTPRELTVLGLLVEGLTAAAIGRRLEIGERTVQKHLEHAYTKLGVGDRLSAVLRAQHLGLLPLSA